MKQLSLPLDFSRDHSQEATWFQQILQALHIKDKSVLPDKFGISIRKWLDKQNYIPIKTLSLFSGGGGLDIAFHDAGFDIIQMVELENKYVKTLQKNSMSGKSLENSQPICIDIKDFFPSTDLQVDFIIGGPPCQSFSAAGRRAAGVSGTSDSRGTLFEEYVRLLKTLQPKGFLFENVYGIIGAQKGKDWQAIQDAFKNAGYKIYFRILDAADYGVPQHRERLFIIGLKEGNYLFPYPTHGPDSPGQEPFINAKDALIKVDTSELIEEGIGGKYGNLLNDIPPGLNYSFYTEEMGHPNPVFSWRSKFSDFLYKADPEMPVRTIKAQGGQYTGPFSWENRKFTVAELKRLQTIPDAYEIVGNRQICIEQIGNSVPPQLGRILALSILDSVMGIALPFPMHYLPENKQLGFRKRKRQLTKIYAQKAKERITFLNKNKPKSILIKKGTSKEELVRYISDDFTWSKRQLSKGRKIHIKYELSDNYWVIMAKYGEIQKNTNKFTIEILPCWGNENWVLDTDKVKLCVQQMDTNLFTAVWKAFEEKLTQITGLADLVQLSGYYQYSPKITGIMNFEYDSKINNFWHILQSLVMGIGVAKQLSACDLASLWTVEPEKIFSYLQSLRSIGYEVRNHNTNSQIPQDKYLIPYAFPTLTPRSVQLRKSLGNINE
ncbi:MAG: DNA cytosine methyltransferase [Cyanobacteria bacterium P01_A01_bin.68]